ncbi:hypothetical protein [Nostoc sp. FACHB-110]|uniref:hypothetical protein n=1 Tax=Nostoc sp. FACHB-110 TaxID=2692834 RepID=UPI0016890C21|nr:hypothetical protein [Nostoc sp. FACHB-110]MBD2437336.1 hypothetical protein [Nostoc sp. FACHB-110]
MIDPINFRNDILAILGNKLGNYTFPDGGTTTAIATLPDPDLGYQYPPHGTKTSGLEVVIKRPYPEAEGNLGGDRTLSYTWEVHLKQWDTQDSLIEAIGLLSGDLPGDYSIERVSFMPPSEKLLTVEQCKIFIQEWAVAVPV